MGWPETRADLARPDLVRFQAPDHINDLRFRSLAASVTLQTAGTADNGTALCLLVRSGMDAPRFTQFMVAEDLKAGRLIGFRYEKYPVFRPGIPGFQGRAIRAACRP